jgi:hypothetical protein
MNYIVRDSVTGGVLYGTVLLKEIKRTGKPAGARVFQIPAEAWIAFLQVRYHHVPEVKAYLQAAEEGEGINPQEGALLEAIDQRLDIPIEEFEHGLKLCGIPTGEDDDPADSWKA